MKQYFTLPISPEMEPYHQMQFRVIPRTPIFLVGAVLLSLWGIQSAYSKAYRQRTPILLVKIKSAVKRLVKLKSATKSF